VLTFFRERKKVTRYPKFANTSGKKKGRLSEKAGKKKSSSGEKKTTRRRKREG